MDVCCGKQGEVPQYPLSISEKLYLLHKCRSEIEQLKTEAKRYVVAPQGVLCSLVLLLVTLSENSNIPFSPIAVVYDAAMAITKAMEGSSM